MVVLDELLDHLDIILALVLDYLDYALRLHLLPQGLVECNELSLVNVLAYFLSLEKLVLHIFNRIHLLESFEHIVNCILFSFL